MKTSVLYMERMRRSAREYLPAAFSHQVVRRAVQRKIERVHIQIVAVTAFACVATAVSVRQVQTNIAQRKNLAAWSEAAAQVRVLEESL